jgi:hypothetical protein
MVGIALDSALLLFDYCPRVTWSPLSEHRPTLRADIMDIPERTFLAVAAAGIAVIVVLTSLVAAGPADPVLAGALQALNGFHPAPFVAGRSGTADHEHAPKGMIANR